MKPICHYLISMVMEEIACSYSCAFFVKEIHQKNAPATKKMHINKKDIPKLHNLIGLQYVKYNHCCLLWLIHHVSSLIHTPIFMIHYVQRKIPDVGWSDTLIETLLAELSHMDSNNLSGNVGVGEREGRIHSDLVRRRHFR